MQVAQQQPLKQEELSAVVKKLLYNNAMRSNEGKKEYELPTAFEHDKIAALESTLTYEAVDKLNSKKTYEEKLMYLSGIWQERLAFIF